jgi:outer membrane lipopolysaccharide assembly protein LptE/RlpB
VKQSDGKELIQPNNLTVLRDLLYEEALVLGKAEGERLMIENMVDDVAWSIVRRLQVIGS